MANLSELGPSGGTGGNSGDTDSDAGFIQPLSRVTNVLLTFDDTNHHALESVRFVHDGATGLLPHHGGAAHEETNVHLNLDEHITKISGTYNKDGDKGPFVTSVQIETTTGANNTTVPPGGVTDGAKYTYAAPDNFEIVGFFGRSGSLIDAIGVVVRKIGA